MSGGMYLMISIIQWIAITAPDYGPVSNIKFSPCQVILAKCSYAKFQVTRVKDDDKIVVNPIAISQLSDEASNILTTELQNPEIAQNGFDRASFRALLLKLPLDDAKTLFKDIITGVRPRMGGLTYSGYYSSSPLMLNYVVGLLSAIPLSLVMKYFDAPIEVAAPIFIINTVAGSLVFGNFGKSASQADWNARGANSRGIYWLSDFNEFTGLSAQ
jgi:hypothetical protein